MQCSLSKRRFTSPSPPPNHPFFSMLVVFKNYSSPLVTVLSLVSQGCYCPSRASSLIDQLLNLILRKRQHFNFLWRVDALFLGLPAPCVSPGAGTLQRAAVWTTMGPWDSQCKSTCRRKSGFTEPPTLKIAGCCRARHLQQAACYTINTISASLHHHSLQTAKKVAHLSFLHPWGMNDTVCLHTAGSTEWGTRAEERRRRREGRKRGKRTGREAVMPPTTVHSSKMLPHGLSVGTPRRTGGNFGRGNWDGGVGGWEQALSIHTENGGCCARFLFLKALLHAVTSYLTGI